MTDEKTKKPISKWVMIIILTAMLFTSYYLGIVEGNNNGKIELCKDMGGVYAVNTDTKTKMCYNSSVVDNDKLDFQPKLSGGDTDEYI